MLIDKKDRKWKVFGDNMLMTGRFFKRQDAILRIGILDLTRDCLIHPFAECPDKPKEHSSFFSKNRCRVDGILS